jgi:signal transduction histidine kinase
VDGVLDFSRPKKSARTLLDMNGVLEKTLFLLKHHSRFKKLTVQLDAESPLPFVSASEEQLVQVLMALLINAMDAMHERGTIVLRTRADATRDAVITEVIDQGEGIRSADLPKIFEPFYTTKPPGRGTGLGLSICYSLVAENSGRIEVESVVGRGSVFRIVLPAVSSQPLRAAV